MTDLPFERRLTAEDDEWPARTPAEITRLRVRGGRRLDDLTRRAVAIFGTKAATPYGSFVAHDFAVQLAKAGYVVATTGAHGVAGAATRGALAGSGRVLVAPTGGVDSPSPLVHRALFERVAGRGAIVGAGVVGDLLVPACLLAAWSRAVVLIEPAARGQSAVIAQSALAAGVPVLAVPGPITSATSAYAHTLIRHDRARLVASVADVLADLPAA